MPWDGGRPVANVVIIAPHFWPEKIGSAPYCTDLAIWLADQGHDVSALSFRPHYPSVTEFADWQDGSRDGEAPGGVTIVRVPNQGRGSGGLRARAMNDLRFLARLSRTVFDRKFSKADAIYAFVPSTVSLYGAKALALRSRARLICVVHDIESGLAGSLGFTSGNLALSAIRQVEKIGLNLADEIIVLTHGMKRELRRLKCHRPIRVLPLWCGIPSTDAAAPDANFTVAYSGNFGKKQNLDQLLPVFEMLQQQCPDVQIQLRGDGSERSRLERSIGEMGLTNTTFHALVDADQLSRTIQGAHLHLVPQAPNIGDYAIPSKVYTILAAGRPFVCIAEPDTELAALARDSGGGLCVEPNNSNALFTAIRQLVDDRTRLERMGADARRYAVAHLTMAGILEEYERSMERDQVYQFDSDPRLETGT